MIFNVLDAYRDFIEDVAELAEGKAESTSFNAAVDVAEDASTTNDMEKKPSPTASSEKHENNKSTHDYEHSQSHFKHLFHDDTCEFYCKVSFAREFESFRAKIIESQTDMILSLAECSRFKSSGGKSGVKFYKTKDDRFLLKELNRPEARDFNNSFAPKYLEYMTKAHKDGGQSTLLAKILGVFEVGYKNSAANRSSAIVFIVMENLLYGRTNIAGSYDLKGSRR